MEKEIKQKVYFLTTCDTTVEYNVGRVYASASRTSTHRSYPSNPTLLQIFGLQAAMVGNSHPPVLPHDSLSSTHDCEVVGVHVVTQPYSVHHHLSKPAQGNRGRTYVPSQTPLCEPSSYICGLEVQVDKYREQHMLSKGGGELCELVGVVGQDRKSTL